MYGRTMITRPTWHFLLLSLSVFVLFGCGSSRGAGTNPTSTPSTAAGDIADTATYLTYHGRGYSMKYVEGWGIQQGPGSGVTISDKDSSETLAVQRSQSLRTGALASRD